MLAAGIGSEELGALRTLSAGRVVLLVGGGGGELSFAMAQPGSRVCIVDRFPDGTLGTYLEELRKREIIPVTHGGNVVDHDMRRLVGDWWESDRETTLRGMSQRRVVCLHSGDPAEALPHLGHSFYSLGVVDCDVLRDSGLMDGRLTPGSRLVLVNATNYNVNLCRLAGWRPLRCYGGLVVLEKW